MVFLSQQPIPRQSVRRRGLCRHVFICYTKFMGLIHMKADHPVMCVIFYWSILLALVEDGSSSYFIIEKACGSQILQADHGKTLPHKSNARTLNAKIWSKLKLLEWPVHFSITSTENKVYIYIHHILYASHFWKTSYLSTYISYLCVHFDPSAYTELTCRSMVSGSRFDSGFSAGSLDQVSVETAVGLRCGSEIWVGSDLRNRAHVQWMLRFKVLFLCNLLRSNLFGSKSNNQPKWRTCRLWDLGCIYNIKYNICVLFIQYTNVYKYIYNFPNNRRVKLPLNKPSRVKWFTALKGWEGPRKDPCRDETSSHQWPPIYNGHKRVHAIKFQSVVAPNGLVANLYGPTGKLIF